MVILNFKSKHYIKLYLSLFCVESNCQMIPNQGKFYGGPAGTVISGVHAN